MHAFDNEPLPVQQWSAAMKTAIEEICEVGLRTLETHRKASDEAAAIADGWQLATRLEDERAALLRLFEHARRIIEAIEATRSLMHAAVPETTLLANMGECADAIDENLPHLEEAFLAARHSALDLLRWTQRWGHMEGSELPAQYRASYARLIEYSPVFRPRSEAMQQTLLAMSKDKEVGPETRRLLSALTRYNAVADSARCFVKSVVEPPLELVFHDTESFQQDWHNFDAATRGHLATEINDCCQQLLYDPAEFDRSVQRIRPQLADGIDASLCVLPVDDNRILFTVDEDPVFEQLTITLLRLVPVVGFEGACESIIQDLYRGLQDE
jgi:hypothetical protein